MKKYLSVFVIVISILMLASCGGNGKEPASAEEIIVYEINPESDGRKPECNHVNALKSWNVGDFQRKEAQQEMRIEYQGQSYTGRYEYSAITEYELSARDYYICEQDGNDVVQFSINSSNGLCESVRDYTKKSESGLNLSVEAIQEAVFEFAGQYIDIDKYTLTVEEYEENYSYLFLRYIGEYHTCERFVVLIYKTGEIYKYFGRMTDEFSRYCEKSSMDEIEKTVNRLSSEESEKAVDERICTMYPNLKNYEIRGRTIILFDSETIGMAYTIETEFESTPLGNDSFASNRTLDDIIVTLGTP